MKELILLAVAFALFAVVPAAAGQHSRPRIAIFVEPGFPTIDGSAVDVDAVRAALAAFDVSVLDANALTAALDAARVDVLVLPFGSAFPQAAWPSIERFLSAGGSFVSLGGVPFAVPAVSAQGGWRTSPRTPSYHRQLGIVQAFPVVASSLRARPSDERDPLSVSLARGEAPRRIYQLMVRFSSEKNAPDEDGSDGPRDARLLPLVHAFGAGRLPVAAPVVQIDRLRGRFAGGRWILVTGDGGVSSANAAALVVRAAAGPVELRVQPRYAGFHPGEPVALSVTLLRPGRTAGADARADIQVTDQAGRTVASTSAPLAGAATAGTASADITLPIDSATMEQGLYEARAEMSLEPAVRPATLPAQPGRGATGSRRTEPLTRSIVSAVSGFWIYDQAMVKGGRAIVAGRDYFARDGVPFPVAGTTYMASDVHRRFLLEPNPSIWERDFAEMALSGVTLVRTGIWTGWALHSDSDGNPTESMLRALEVFVLTARRHDVPIIFNLFAFVPATWGGRNPYFDRRSLDAQKRFAGGMASRLAGARDLIWDLINEPSFSSPARLWQCRPNYDTDEQAAWDAWLRETVTASDDASRAALLHQRWNSLPDEGLGLPALGDFADRNLFASSRPNKAADYKRFAQDSFARWVSGISAAIRTAGSDAQLITVGQDEGGAGERPNPLIFGRGVDFTGTHTWWNNDALLWDGVVAKRPDRPSLIEETGLMTYERPDGTAWRTDADARNLLERKMALAFASGGAGFVQWLWNTNVYMPIDNEAGIGFLRDDGTAKPELEAFERVARFVSGNGRRFAGRALEDVAIVAPLSAVLSARDQGTPATQRAVRVLEYELRVPVRAVSEYEPDLLRRGARLLVLPSPRVLTEPAWQALLEAVGAGSTLLVTGPIDRDEYERPIARLVNLGIHATTRPVSPENRLVVDGTSLRVPFRGGKLERVERAAVEGAEGARVEVIRHGKGSIVWCPLPVELSDDERATAAVYRLALGVAGVRPSVTVTGPAGGGDGVLVRSLAFDDSLLLVVVNENDADRDLRVAVTGAPWPPVRVRVAAERALMVLVDKKTGATIGTTEETSERSARARE